MKYKILWLSSATLGKYPDYKDAILRHGRKILSPEFELETRGVKRGSSVLHYYYVEFLNSQEIMENIIQAERDGFSAVAIGCFLDPVLDEAREVANIPVVSMGQTAMLLSCMFGRSFSIITYTPQLNAKKFRSLIAKYGLESRAIRGSSFDVSLEALANSFKDPAEIIESFQSAARKAIAEGAEVILPGCGLLNLIIVENKINQVDGATVLDVSGALLKMAEASIVLKEVSGVKVSRKGFYEAPSQAFISELREIYGVYSFPQKGV
jgi:Asp/Glu/hydantoin racemase